MAVSTKKSRVVIKIALLMIVFGFSQAIAQTTYYSQGTGNFSTLSNWNTFRAGGGSSPISLTSGDDFVIQSPHTITLDNSTPQILSLSIETGATFDNSSNTLSVGWASGSGGLLDIQGTGLYQASTGTLNFFKAGFGTPSYTVQAAQGVSFNNITFSDGSFSFNSTSGTQSFTINGNFKVSNNAGSVSLSNINLSYGDNSKIEYSPGANYTIGPEWTSNLNAASITLNMPSFTLNGTGNRTVKKILNLTDGTLDLGTDTLYVQGNLVGGDVTGSGTVANSTILAIGNGSGSLFAQSITGTINLNKLSVNKAGGTGGAEGTANTVTCSGQLRFTANATMEIKAGTLVFTSSGRLDDTNLATLSLLIQTGGVLKTGGQDLTGIGTISATTGKIAFSGATQETLPISTTIGTLELKNVSGAATSLGTLTVGSNLVLTSGKLVTTSDNKLLLASTASVSGTPSSSNMVAGPLQKAFAIGVSSFLYPVGYGTSYRPATFDYLSNNVATSIIQIETVSGDPGGTKPIGINSIATSHHYIVKEVGTPGTFTYNFTGTYTGTGFTPESRNQLIVQSGVDPAPLYSYPKTIDQIVNTTAKTVKIIDALSALPSDDGKIAFGSIGVQITWDGGASGTGTLWSTAANWVGDVVPQTGDDVFFDHSVLAAAYSVTYDAGTTKNEFSSIAVSPGGANSITLTLSRTNTITLTSTSNALVVGSNGKLTFSGTAVSMGAGFDNTRTDFQAGSTVEYTTGSVNVDEYNELIINGATGTAGSGTITVNGNLIKSSSTGFITSEAVSVTGTYTNTLGDAAYNGGLTANGTPFTVTSGVVGGVLNIKSATTTVNGGSFGGTANFNGAAAQTLNGSASAVFSNLTINNSAGLTLNTTAQANGTITFTDGLITTSDVNLLTFGSGATVGVGNDNSYVNGPLARAGATGSAVLYPIGKSSYRPVSTNLTGSTPTVRFEVFDSSPNQSHEAQIIRISIVRYWRGQITSGSISTGSVTLHYGLDDGVTNFDAQGDVVVARSSDNNTDTYKSLGGESSGTTGTGTVTSTVSVGSSLNYFTLGTTTGDNSLPVELSSFEAVSAFNQVVLKWNTQSELENLGFNVYRARTADPENWTVLNETMIPGQGTYTHATDYEYVDRNVAAGEAYLYKLESVSVSGLRVDERTIEVAVPVPDQYALFKNYPNPFNPTTNIRFQLPDVQNVKLAVYDIRGSLVKTVVNNQAFPAGEHTVTWDATDNNGSRVASGMYIYRFEAGKFSKIDKMILLK